MENSENASKKIQGLMQRLGLERHKEKEVSGKGSTVVEHLGFRWGSVASEFTATEAKQGTKAEGCVR